ncbi:MAG: hypothetical protein H6925_06570 [Holosporaceae bacterium]|nr:MAG: hypothetical protein H6925_06570 [Holosporaceae bacterium]
MCHHFHPSILREYDVRGVFQETLHPEDAFFVGRCYATFLSGAKPKVAVAWDGRLSSPILKESLIEGLQASGMEVVEIGVGPTPLLYFSVHHMKLDGGIMVTGSHNPKNHNGFKMMFKDHIITGPEIHSFQEIVKSFPKDVALGGRKSEDLSEAYVQRLLKDLKIEKKDLNIVWDAGNGAAGQLVEMLIQRIPGKHTALFCDIDGTFPNHHPDPSKAENLADLKKMVLKNKANLGFAFDGDGDRLGVVDEKGDPLPVDQLIMMLAREVLKAIPVQRLFLM